MAGRAGRRGLDKVGTVIITCWSQPPELVNLKVMKAQGNHNANRTGNGYGEIIAAGIVLEMGNGNGNGSGSGNGSGNVNGDGKGSGNDSGNGHANGTGPGHGNSIGNYQVQYIGSGNDSGNWWRYW